MSNEIEISDIQETKDGNVEITLCAEPSWDDFMKITLGKHQLWKIHDFCHNNLSYAAELKKQGKSLYPNKPIKVKRLLQHE